MNFSDNFNNIVEKTNDLSQYSIDELKELINEAESIQKQYKNLQLVVKADANSLYGVSASIYFSLHDTDIAEDICMTGKHFAIIVDRSINNFFVTWGLTELKKIQEFYPQVIRLRQFTEYKPDTINDLCVYGDTDSRYIDLEKIYSFLETSEGKMILPETDKELADFGCFVANNFFNKIIKETIEADCDYRNARKGYLRMTHEVTTRKCVFQKKKKYILTKIWEDGKLFESPKLKFQGVELKKGGSSPRIKKILSKLVHKYLLDSYDIPMLRIECIKLIKYIKTRNEKDFIYSITSVSGLKNIEKNSNNIYDSDKNHIQMQICISWMNFIEENKLQDQYKHPFEGQKMNYYYTQDSKYKVIGVPDDVNINKVIGLPEPDWNKMLNTNLLKPLLKYIYDKEEILDIDIEHFLLGVKQWNF